MKPLTIVILFLVMLGVLPVSHAQTTNAKTFTKPKVAPTPGRATGGARLTPVKDPLWPGVERTGNYELRYIESRPDDHLNLKIRIRNGRIYLTDTGSSLQSASYTLNGWTDLENCGELKDEPIRPYRLYHVLKFSVARPNITEWWMAEFGDTRAEFRRSELFFYVVPKQETWNPVGESPNPIGRPAAFAKIPPFKLKNRIYGFEYDFLDETDERQDELDISFNRKSKKRHSTLYAGVLSQYLESLPQRKSFEELTEQECIDFANTITVDFLLAFDIEPGEGTGWMISYGPNFNHNMGLVINRLKARGALAYNWMGKPAESPNNLFLGDEMLQIIGGYGPYNRQLNTFREAYAKIATLKKRDNPNSIINTGYGYVGYDINTQDSDGNGLNASPQLTYLRALDASELWSRAYPDKDQLYFSWPFMEYNNVRFPVNHVVNIPQYKAVARRTDNKALYPPAHWQDNLMLGLINAKYLFYWSPGPVGWDPANVSSTSSTYANGGFFVWEFEKGTTPKADKYYIGKEAMAINATLSAAYMFSQIQDAMDGARTGLKFSYKRAKKDLSLEAKKDVAAIPDGSWFTQSLINKQPFVILCTNGEHRALLAQDVWARPGAYTEFSIELDGKTVTVKTEGNRLFVATLAP